MAVGTARRPGQRISEVQNPYSILPNWLYPTFVAVVLGIFGLYSIWAIFFQTRGYAAPYLTPFSSPYLWVGGPIPSAIWVAWAPFAFRTTCYYYRKAYFRSYFWHPQSCAVSEPERPGTFKKYRGETIFPWVLNNLHRFALYVILIQVGFLWYDVFNAFRFGSHWGVGVGTVLMLINVLLLSGYTFGCHALRHLTGGGLDCFSCSQAAKARFKLWKGVTILNIGHDRWAWASLFSVWAVDIYVRLLMHGSFLDPRWVPFT